MEGRFARLVCLCVALCAFGVLAGCGEGGEKGGTSGRSTATTAAATGDGTARGVSAEGRRTRELVPPDFERRVFAGAGGRGNGVVVAPLAGGPIRAFGDLSSPHAWSTIKPVIAVAVSRARHAGELPGGRTLTASERGLIARAIENSDNAAAAALFGELGRRPEATAALQRVLAAAGDRRTHVNEKVTRPPFSSYGQTVWALPEEARFYRQLANGCLADPRDTGLVLADMGAVTEVGGSGWGLPVARFPELRFKAGWGPEHGQTGYTALQYGIVRDARRGGSVIGVVAETHGDASTAYATATDLAQRAAALLRGRHGPTGKPRC